MIVGQIQAEHIHGCAPACIAMILGWKYKDVTKWFSNDFNQEGITHEQSAQFICDQGYTAISKEVFTYQSVNEHRERMLTPFAPIHLVSLKPYYDSVTGHAVVMLSEGSLLDPHTEPWTWDEFYYIRQVTGFWREKL